MEEKRRLLETELINHPEFIPMLLDPIYQQLFSWQKRAFFEGSMSIQDIFKNLQMMKRKKDDFEKLVTQNISSVLPILTEDRNFIRFREGFNIFMDDPVKTNIYRLISKSYSTTVSEFLESVTNGL